MKKSLFRRLTKEISSIFNKNLIALYLVGTAATSEKFKDIDLFAVVKKPLSEDEESKLISGLTKKYGIKIGIRTIAYDELLGKKEKITLITKVIPIRILIKVLKAGKCVYGKLNLEKLPVKPLSPKNEIKHEIERLRIFLDIIKKGEKLPFQISDFPKFVAYLVRAELQLKGKPFEFSYKKMAKMLKNKPEHIIHNIVAIREGKKKLNKKFLNKVEDYIKEVKKRMR